MSTRPTGSPKRAIGIVRVSQRDDDSGHSPEVQVRAMLKQAEDGDFTLAPADIWDENVDAQGKVRPKSGGASLADRPKLSAAVEAIEDGKASVIVAERFDRLFRDLDVQREVIRRVEAAGGRLETAAGKISHATAEAELQSNLNGAIASYTKRTAMERSWDAVEIAIEEGRVPWKDTTPGYDTADGRLVPDEQAWIIEQAFRLRADGAPVTKVREHLAEHGIQRSFHGAQHLLRSRVVLGELHFGKHTPNLAAHEPIVDRELWQHVQRVRVPRGRRAKSERLLARLGVLRCASCGSRMVVGSANHSRYRVYRCPPTGDCAQRVTIAAEVAEAVVVEAVRAGLEGTVGWRAARKNVREARAALDLAQAALDAAIRSFTGLEGEAAVVERLRELQAARDAARVRAEQIEGPADDDFLLLLDEDWDQLSIEDQRRCVRATISRAEVRPAEKGEPPESRIEVVYHGTDEQLLGRTPARPTNLQ